MATKPATQELSPVSAHELLSGLLSADSDFPGLPYVIFPGNVSTTETLARVVGILRERPKA